jgi:uncharacterized repeat protein (TIGR03803 family)
MKTVLLLIVVLTSSVLNWAGTEKVLYSFGAPGDGSEPVAGLTFDGNGNLYGTAWYGGNRSLYCSYAGCGLVFRLTADGNGNWQESIVYSFGGTDGGNPNSPIVFDNQGNIYGTTQFGGTSGYGAVFQLSPSSNQWTESIIHSFTYTGYDGSFPQGVAFDNQGHLYGTTSFNQVGYAYVFSLAAASGMNWYELVLHSFGGRSCGQPAGVLTFDREGNIYGTTYDGGSTGAGVVYKVSPNRHSSGWTYAEIYTFQGSPFGKGNDGANPRAGVIFDAAGNLYGTTEWGGTAGLGTVFKLTPNSEGGWSESILHTFSGGGDGGHPFVGSLAFDAYGNLYGTTSGGAGTGSEGTVYRLSPNDDGTWTEAILYAFSGGADGSNPLGNVVLDAAGNVYGTTVNGGAYGSRGSGGVVFEITP